ncbi:CHRD domain-containing protein [Microseira wollei]|uniref:CHRD domain-containing protein n=1 Tax=Microseira wollei NIES-4236 TaxID=2530354 RepID=A0AAV3XS78_9CYAN|nr:CHRD domain-containing protein [Microseira wollei]GET43522.1 CHRD domain-containing protein [Microseira wollei NIES-4236]
MRSFIGLLIGTLFTLAILFGSPTMAQNQQFGDQSFTEYEAYLNPAQELGPASGSKAKGYGRLRFPKNLTKSDINVQLADIDPANVTAFHIHCGTPDVLGPIIVNFGQFGDFKNTIVNGRFSASVTNEKLTFVKQPPPPPNLSSGFKLPLPEGCPSDIIIPAQINTIAGMEALARKGVLYFNLHTKGHEFYGEMRGQIYPVQKA